MDDDFEYRVRIRAYDLWRANGNPNGVCFWNEAEAKERTCRVDRTPETEAKPDRTHKDRFLADPCNERSHAERSSEREDAAYKRFAEVYGAAWAPIGTLIATSLEKPHVASEQMR